MKNIFRSIISCALLLSLFSCNTQNDADTSFKMKAKIKDITNKIEVEVIEAEYAEGIYLIVYSSETVVTDKNGNSTSIKNLKVGDTIEISYNGQVMMSYPPKIVALSIRVL